MHGWQPQQRQCAWPSLPMWLQCNAYGAPACRFISDQNKVLFKHKIW